MAKFTLSTPQRTLAVLAVAVFLICLGLTLLVVYQTLSNTANRQIHVTYQSTAPQDANHAQRNAFSYDELITQPAGESTLSWDNHTLTLFGPATATFSADTIQVMTGYAYIDFTAATKLKFGSNLVTLAAGNGVYQADNARFTVLTGGTQLPDGETAAPNNIILFDGTKFTTTTLDRSTISTSALWSRILTLLTNQNTLPFILKDLSIPKLTGLAPADASIMTTSEQIITATTKPETQVIVAGKHYIADAQGNFTAPVVLTAGINKIQITLVDKYGNQLATSVSYTYNPPVVKSTTGTTASTCQTGTMAEALLCLINNYRSQQGLATLAETASLNQAAVGHASWMNTYASFGHLGAGGSSPVDRCNTAGTTCSAENLAQINNGTAQAVFDLWVNTSADNQNLAGVFTQIGIGISGDYTVAVFH